MNVRISLRVALVLMIAACEGAPSEPTYAIFELASHQSNEFFNLPYPNNLRINADKKINLANYNENRSDLVSAYLSLVEDNLSDGFSIHPTIFFRFSKEIDPRSLKDAVFLTALDPMSKDYGKKIPIDMNFRVEESALAASNLLAIRPISGFSLLPKTSYAAFISDSVVDKLGISIQATKTFTKLLAKEVKDNYLQHAHQNYQAIRNYIEAHHLTNIVSATIFTTGDPTTMMKKARDVINRHSRPIARDLSLVNDQDELYVEFQGSYQAINFQQGEPPYLESGGNIKQNIIGEPIPARIETMRFAMSVPKGEMPQEGWPVVLYAHGTGGDYRTFIRNRTASSLANIADEENNNIAGFVVIGIDQVLHGARDDSGMDPELSFFNYLNPKAALGNVQQAAIDNYSLVYMLDDFSPQSADLPDGFKIDKNKLYFFGHSQGGITGSLFLGFEPKIKGAVLSGNGGDSTLSLTEERKDFPVKTMLEVILAEPIDPLHPILGFIQHLMDLSDPNSYARYIVNGSLLASPKALFVSEGIGDRYTPNKTAESFAVAMGVPQVNPIFEIEGLSLKGIQPITLNKDDKKSIFQGFYQYMPDFQVPEKNCSTHEDCSGYCDEGKCRLEGHFVIYTNKNALRQSRSFLATLARKGLPEIQGY